MWSCLPGETPIDDLSGLIPEGVESRADLNRHEAENIRQAMVTYLAARPSAKRAPFDVGWFLKLHREMFGQVWEWAGKLRTTTKNLGAAPELLVEELKKLSDDVQYWFAQQTPEGDPHQLALEQSARLHHRAVWLHPFENGNGRWARMLANIFLLRKGQAPIAWPEAAVCSVSTLRKTYLATVRYADAGDLRPLIELHQRYQER